jgi:hypothetical protein
MHDAFAQFGAFSQDAIDNQALLGTRGKLKMPILGRRRREVFRLTARIGALYHRRRCFASFRGRSLIMEENPQPPSPSIEFQANKVRNASLPDGLPMAEVQSRRRACGTTTPLRRRAWRDEQRADPGGQVLVGRCVMPGEWFRSELLHHDAR